MRDKIIDILHWATYGFTPLAQNEEVRGLLTPECERIIADKVIKLIRENPDS